MSYVDVTARVALGLVFGLSVAGKLRGRAVFAAFAASVREVAMVPPSLAAPVAAAVAGVELTVVGLLAVPATATAGLVLGAGLLSAFAAVIARARVRKSTATCHCFGAAGARFGWPHLVRNVALIALATAGAVASSGSPEAASPGGLVVAVLTAAVIAAIAARVDDLVQVMAGVEY